MPTTVCISKVIFQKSTIFTNFIFFEFTFPMNLSTINNQFSELQGDSRKQVFINDFCHLGLEFKFINDSSKIIILSNVFDSGNVKNDILSIFKRKNNNFRSIFQRKDSEGKSENDHLRLQMHLSEMKSNNKTINTTHNQPIAVFEKIHKHLSISDPHIIFSGSVCGCSA
jgi:hypothetical protein